MLTKVATKKLSGSGLRIAIIASKYNLRFVDGMVKPARHYLEKTGVEEIKVYRVPGAFEIPALAACLATDVSPRPSAIICLGVILRGATTHAQHIGEAVSNALAQIQMLYRVPIIHEVLLLENDKQAVERCLSVKHNRGVEAAQTAVEMANLFRTIHSDNI